MPIKGSAEQGSGYLHPKYADSLGEFGKLHELRSCGGWVLERKIPGSTRTDAMGCYPLFCCRDWTALPDDLEKIGKDLVCLSLVTDPFGNWEEALLRRCFPDRAFPFKEHHVVDLSKPPDITVSEHHRRNARKALNDLSVDVPDDPASCLEDWHGLYASLIAKRRIKGITAFSKAAFRKQLAVPGITVFRAVRDNTAVAMLLWYVQGERAYYHLGASSDVGYESRASFALFWEAINHFSRQGLRWISLGAGAGAKGDQTDGLTRFKRGWSEETRKAWFCGRIFDRKAYDEIVKAGNIAKTEHFPAYRAGEFDSPVE